MIHSYKTLNNPISQIEAAVEFCASVHAYVKDEHEGEPVDVGDIRPLNILDSLARIGLRFETSGKEEGEGSYFSYQEGESLLDQCLYAYARRFAEDIEENGFVEGDAIDLFELVTFHGCFLEDLIFVPDYDGVVSAAYFLALSPGHLPDDAPSKVKP